MMRVGVTGGIGSGKSVVCSAIERLGYSVYNADDRAKWLISNDAQLIDSIKQIFGNEAYVNGEYNRSFVRKMVFADSFLLNELNSAVHPVVAADFESWVKRIDDSLVFMEAAIIFESGFNRLLDRIIAVTAPDEMRIERVMKRDGAIREQVLARMNNQMSTSELVAKSDFVILNDQHQLIIPQIIDVINLISSSIA